MVKRAVIIRRHDHRIGAIVQTFALDDRNLIKGVTVARYAPRTIFILVTVVSIYRPVLNLFFFVCASALVNPHANGAGLSAGHADQVEASAAEGELCRRPYNVIRRSHFQRYLHCRAKTVLAAILVCLIIPIDIVGINGGQAELAGSVFSLRGFSRRPFLRPPHRSFVVLRAVLRAVRERHKAVLIVDGRCGDDRHGAVIVSIVRRAAVGHRIGELICIGHLHRIRLRRIPNNAFLRRLHVGDYLRLAVHSGMFRGRKCGCSISRSTAIRLYRADILQRTLAVEHIVLQNVNVHRQAIVDDDRIRHTLHFIFDREPNDSVRIVVAVITSGAGCGRLAAIFGDIGGSRRYTIATGH